MQRTDGSPEPDPAGTATPDADPPATPDVAPAPASDLGLALARPGSPTGQADPLLAEMDEVLQERSERTRREDEYERRLEERRLEFLRAFSDLCTRVVRPTMEIVLDRLRRDGGGGRIVEHPGGEPRFTLPQITLWMSLQGELAGEGREDRNPYFRLDADPARGIVRVHQGDMWLGGGSHSSGETDTWQLAEITRELIEQQVVEILRRAAR